MLCIMDCGDGCMYFASWTERGRCMCFALGTEGDGYLNVLQLSRI